MFTQKSNLDLICLPVEGKIVGVTLGDVGEMVGIKLGDVLEGVTLGKKVGHTLGKKVVGLNVGTQKQIKDILKSQRFS